MHQQRPPACKRLLPALFFLLVVPIHARDFHDPYATIDPIELLSDGGPGAVMDWEYNQQVFRASDLDDFQMSIIGGAGLFRSGDAASPAAPDPSVDASDSSTAAVRAGDRGPRFALGMRYGTYLLAGPGGEDLGTPHLDWRMMSIQFQYGVHASFALSSRVRLLAEYSRLSNHPFMNPEGYVLADVAFDRLAVGLGVPAISFGADGRISASARLAYVDLWDAWEAHEIATSRVQWNLRTGILATHPLPVRLIADHRPQAFLEVHPDLFTQHDRAGIDATISGRLGLRLADTRTSRVVDAYLDTYFSRDTEQAVGQQFPVRLFGLGVRVGNASRP